MTFYEFGIKRLTEWGMFDNQAKEVMLREMETNEPMQGRWMENMESYPDIAKNIIWMGIEYTALEYIKEKCPEAWFRPLFDKNHPLRKEFEALDKK